MQLIAPNLRPLDSNMNSAAVYNEEDVHLQSIDDEDEIELEMSTIVPSDFVCRTLATLVLVPF